MPPPTAAAVVGALRAALQAAGNPAVAAEKAAYLKHVAPVVGVKTPALEALHAQHVLAPLAGAPRATVLEVFRLCVADEVHEMKQGGVLTAWRLRRALLPDADADAVGALLDATEALYDGGAVNDWATSDGLCGRVLFCCIVAAPATAAARVASWRTSPHLWKQRSAAVAFVKLAKPQYGHRDTILAVCDAVVRRPDRFAQLGCGWVLRELGMHYPGHTQAFIEAHYAHFSREGLRYALEKTDAPTRARLLAYQPPPPPPSLWVMAASGSAAAGAAGSGRRGAGGAATTDSAPVVAAAGATAAAASTDGGSGRKRKR
jgi:hypothetical protein